MVDNDSNMIKPVESLQNIAGLTPAKRRENRKRRQQLQEENKQSAEQKPNQAADEQELRLDLDGNDQSTIDYRA